MYYIIAVIIIVLVVLISFIVKANNKDNDKVTEENLEVKKAVSDCCGAHEICEFDEMSFSDDHIIYFNDEELDLYKGIAEDNYDDRQIEEFREVLYTLQKNEIKSWLNSLMKRRIHLPVILQTEARQLISE